VAVNHRCALRRRSRPEAPQPAFSYDACRVGKAAGHTRGLAMRSGERRAHACPQSRRVLVGTAHAIERVARAFVVRRAPIAREDGRERPDVPTRPRPTATG
jgi:hypothetical protein